MRKDVILGMTIGGVMLAAIVIYLTISPNKSNRHPVDPGYVDAGSSGGAGDAQGQGRAEPATPATPPANGGHAETPTKPTTGHTPTTPGPTARGNQHDPWDLLLNSSSNVPITQTPDAPVRTNNRPEGDQPPRNTQFDPVPVPRGPVANTPDNARLVPATGPSVAAGAGAKMHVHKIQTGETFSTIAATLYGSANYYPHLIRANPTIDPTRLKVGMEINYPDASIVIPQEKPAGEATRSQRTGDTTGIPPDAAAVVDPRSEYKVQASDSLYKISVKLYGKADMVDKIYELNKAVIGPDKAKLKLGMTLKLPEAPVSKP